MSKRSIAITRPLLRAHTFDRDLAPAAGRGAEIDDAPAAFQELRLVVDLGEFVGRARAIALAFRPLHIRDR